MLVSDYITNLRGRLFDPPPGAGWTNGELIDYLNEAIRATCFLKPDAYTLQEAIPLEPGVVQQLPAAGIGLFDITENEASGRRVTITDKSLLDEENRFWPAATPEVDVQHFAVDPRAASRFYVTPPNDGTGSVLALYGALPPLLVGTTDTVPLMDTFQPTLCAFALSRAYGKPSKRADPAKASAMFNEFATLTGAKAQGQAAASPRVAQVQGV